MPAQFRCLFLQVNFISCDHDVEGFALLTRSQNRQLDLRALLAANELHHVA